MTFTNRLPFWLSRYLWFEILRNQILRFLYKRFLLTIQSIGGNEFGIACHLNIFTFLRHLWSFWVAFYFRASILHHITDTAHVGPCISGLTLLNDKISIIGEGVNLCDPWYHGRKSLRNTYYSGGWMNRSPPPPLNNRYYVRIYAHAWYVGLPVFFFQKDYFANTWVQVSPKRVHCWRKSREVFYPANNYDISLEISWHHGGRGWFSLKLKKN